MFDGQPRHAHHARLVGREDAGGGLVCHDLQPEPGVDATYRSPGQYVSLALAGKRTYFALASEPGAATWEVLVRPGGEVVDALLALPLGATVALSAALGEGFPVAEAEGRRLFLLATGSGLAALRPVLKARVRGGLAPSTELFVGVRTPDEVPLQAELRELRERGLAVTVCCSRDTKGDPGVTSGYVQDALLRRAAARPEELQGAMVFAAGVTAMIERLRRVAEELHIAEADVRTNY